MAGLPSQAYCLDSSAHAVWLHVHAAIAVVLIALLVDCPPGPLAGIGPTVLKARLGPLGIAAKVSVGVGWVCTD